MTFHPLTDGGRTSHMAATFVVPPRDSISTASGCLVLFMPSIIGMPNPMSIGMPTSPAIRLPYMSEWGERIGRRMSELGMSQTDLANACGIKPPSVNNWLSGETKMIGGENLVAVARALSTSPEWIMTGKGDAHRQSQPARLDQQMMAEALVAVMKAQEAMRLAFRPAAIAEALARAYDIRILSPGPMLRADLDAFDRMIVGAVKQAWGENAERTTETAAIGGVGGRHEEVAEKGRPAEVG